MSPTSRRYCTSRTSERRRPGRPQLRRHGDHRRGRPRARRIGTWSTWTRTCRATGSRERTSCRHRIAPGTRRRRGPAGDGWRVPPPFPDPLPPGLPPGGGVDGRTDGPDAARHHDPAAADGRAPRRTCGVPTSCAPKRKGRRAPAAVPGAPPGRFVLALRRAGRRPHRARDAPRSSPPRRCSTSRRCDVPPGGLITDVDAGCCRLRHRRPARWRDDEIAEVRVLRVVVEDGVPPHCLHEVPDVHREGNARSPTLIGSRSAS